MKKTTGSDAARILQSLRKTRSGGRPKVMRRCAGCGKRFSARDMRAHVPLCAGEAVRPESRKRKKVKRAA